MITDSELLSPFQTVM
ncbi:pentatricopeptide repeat protein, partial [Moniliophthora roreri]